MLALDPAQLACISQHPADAGCVNSQPHIGGAVARHTSHSIRVHHQMLALIRNDKIQTYA